jgi:uncharacterized phage protein gp47/JayE
MTIRPRDFDEMVADGLDYLTANTEITFLEQGSIARSMIDAPMLELSRLQDFVVTNYDNSFLSAASGPFLDLFGDGLGVQRRTDLSATVFKEDGAIRFYVRTGTLGQRARDSEDSTQGRIPRGTIVSNANGDIQYSVKEDTTFPHNVKSVFVGATALVTGSGANVGPNQLVVHNLADRNIFVTNDLAISSGADQESDDDYRFRLSRAFSTRFSNSRSAVQVAATSVNGVVQVNLYPFARGAGTFDVLVIPRGNKLPKSVADAAARAVDRVTAFGISPRIREPEYVDVSLTVRIRYDKGVGEGLKDALRDQVQSAILNYIGNIPMGGELIVNQLRSSVLGVSDEIIDLTLLSLCIDGRPQAIRNQKLQPDELYTPSTKIEAVVVI